MIASITKSVGKSTHTLSLLDGEIVGESDLGSMPRVTADNLPISKNLSIKRVLLNPGVMRTPHWHANARELTYCVSGTAPVSILEDGSKFSTVVITAGQMFNAASGSLHHIENTGTDVAEFIIAFRNPSATPCSAPPTICRRPTSPRSGAAPETSHPPHAICGVEAAVSAVETPQITDSHGWPLLSDNWDEHLDLHDAIHVGHSTGGGEVVRFLAPHGEARASKAALISAVPPLMVKTDSNPEGLPKSVFDGLQAQLAANRSEFYRALPSGPSTTTTSLARNRRKRSSRTGGARA